MSHLRYCILAWDSAYSFSREQINRQQRKALHILFNLSYHAPVVVTMQAHELFSCVMLYKYLALCYFYMHCRPGCNCCVPEFSKFIVQRAFGLSSHNSPYAAVVPSVRLTVFKHCFAYHVIVLWNSLPDSVHSATILPICTTLRKRLYPIVEF